MERAKLSFAKIPARLFILALKCYKIALSPLLGQRCRFYPSCSTYMSQAIEVHGLLRGLCLGVIRLAKCHPWHPGGMDPVPGKKSPQQKRERI